MSQGQRPEVRLAGEIAAQFAHKPAEVAAETIAGHIRMFWDPRMRAHLAAAHANGEIADPVVARAATLLEA